jgi:hypothetical protein
MNQKTLISIYTREARMKIIKNNFKFLIASFISLILSAGFIPAVAIAHHSTASFDGSKEVVLIGTVKEFQWTNPHTWVQLEVKNEKGEVVEWSIEGGSPGTLSRNGWKKSTFKPGDNVSIKVHPMLNGNPGGSFVGASLADGSTLGR